MAKKYQVREGFVVILTVKKTDGGTAERMYTGGDEVVLEDSDAALHLHKLEFASEKDRAAALAAEEKAAADKRAALATPDVMAQLLELLRAGAQATAPAAPAA